jgi:hypothetical protein
MSETDLKLLIAAIPGLASLLVALFTFITTRANQRDLERLRAELADQKSERDALRDYQYEARKRLYQECGPLLFQLAEHAEVAFNRILTLARTARQGNLEPGQGSWLDGDHYFRVSTLYRLLAPAATVTLIRRRLTHVDLTLDTGIQWQYLLARRAFLAFADDFRLATCSSPPLPYDPLSSGAAAGRESMPEVYCRQGVPLGVIETAAESLLIHDGNESRVMTYGEYELAFEKTGSPVNEAFGEIAYLIDGFHPRKRPVFWRLLVTQACLYRALAEGDAPPPEGWTAEALTDWPEQTRKDLDWQSKPDDLNAAVAAPDLFATRLYLAQRLASKYAGA